MKEQLEILNNEEFGLERQSIASKECHTAYKDEEGTRMSIFETSMSISFPTELELYSLGNMEAKQHILYAIAENVVILCMNTGRKVQEFPNLKLGLFKREIGALICQNLLLHTTLDQFRFGENQ